MHMRTAIAQIAPYVGCLVVVIAFFVVAGVMGFSYPVTEPGLPGSSLDGR